MYISGSRTIEMHLLVHDLDVAADAGVLVDDALTHLGICPCNSKASGFQDLLFCCGKNSLISSWPYITYEVIQGHGHAEWHHRCFAERHTFTCKLISQ